MKDMIHLGCGPIHLKSTEEVKWLNVDIEAKHKPDVCMDYLTIENYVDKEYADAIYSVHSIEHLSYPEGVVKFFTVAIEVLKTGGTLRLVVPDLRKIALLYVNGNDLKCVYDGPFFYNIDCPAERFQFFAREWEHTILFDEQLLTMLMKAAGFKNIKVVPFNISSIPELCGHDRYESESICMEATK